MPKSFWYKKQFFKQWRDTKYFVGTSGWVVSYKVGNKPHTMSPFENKGGYLRIQHSKPHNMLVHRMVYETFVGKLVEGLVIDHIDTNIRNNNYLNLQQITQDENVKRQKRFNK